MYPSHSCTFTSNSLLFACLHMFVHTTAVCLLLGRFFGDVFFCFRAYINISIDIERFKCLRFTWTISIYYYLYKFIYTDILNTTYTQCMLHALHFAYTKAAFVCGWCWCWCLWYNWHLKAHCRIFAHILEWNEVWLQITLLLFWRHLVQALKHRSERLTCFVFSFHISFYLFSLCSTYTLQNCNITPFRCNDCWFSFCFACVVHCV